MSTLSQKQIQALIFASFLNWVTSYRNKPFPLALTPILQAGFRRPRERPGSQNFAFSSAFLVILTCLQTFMESEYGLLPAFFLFFSQ